MQNLDTIFKIVIDEIRDSKEDRIIYDIFKYGFIKKSQDTFKLTELINWLLDNNEDLINEFSSQKITKAIKVIKKRTYIQKRVDYLVEESILMIVDRVKAERNDELTPLYQFTPFLFYGALQFFKNIELSKYGSIIQKHKDYINNHVNKLAGLSRSREYIYFTRIVDRLYSLADFKDFFTFCCLFSAPSIRVDISFIFFPWLYNGILFTGSTNFVQYRFYKDLVKVLLKHKDVILGIYNNLNAILKSLLQLELKISIEQFYYKKFNTYEFELERLQSVDKKDKIVIQVRCKKCNKESAVLVDTKEFVERNYGEKDKSYTFPCKKCKNDSEPNKKNTCYILTDNI